MKNTVPLMSIVDVVLDKEYERSAANKYNFHLYSKSSLYSAVAEDSTPYNVNAAHDENPTEAQKINADNIMDDDNEWK